jgi:phospholipase D1/2
VFRHPDHLPDTQVLTSSFLSSIQGMKMTAANLTKLPGDAIKSIYGMNEDTVL